MPRAVAEPPPPRRVQPLESHASSSADFKDLCYLLTCKSVQEVLRDWGGIISAREQHPSPNPYPNPYPHPYPNPNSDPYPNPDPYPDSDPDPYP